MMNDEIQNPMSHPLEQKIATLRTRVRRLVTLHGLSWVVAAVLGATLLLGLVDYQLRFQDRGIRVICSLLVLGTLGWTCYRYLFLPMTARLRDVDLALRLQRRYPALEDRLVSSVEFLRQSEDDPLAGSPALRRAVVARTTAETERLDFSDVLDARSPRSAVMVSLAICLTAAILVTWKPLASGIAVARLINPFDNLPFPQETHLQLRRPTVTRVARGQPFEVAVVAAANTKLPAEVRIYYRFEGPDGNVTEESERMQRIGDAMVARRENVVRPFSYRAEGGDDRLMAWVHVEVVEPPQIESLSIRLVPPPYTGWPAEKSGKHIRALVGTRAEISAVADRPLKSAFIGLRSGREIDAGPHGTQQRDLAAQFVIDEDFIIDGEQAEAWAFQIIDREGLAGGSDMGGEIRAVLDSPPTVAIEQPAANLFVTTRAVVPLRVVAKDNLAVREVALAFAASDRPEAAEPKAAEQGPKESVLQLYAGPRQVDPQPAGGLSGDSDSGDRRVVEHRWELADLQLSPGTQLTFRATAGDYLPQSGHSRPRQLMVITPEELQERIGGRENLIVTELTRVLKMQRGSRSQVTSLEIRLSEVERLEEADIDRLLPAELAQRQVHRSLTSRSEGVPMHIVALLADLENNRLDSPDVQRRMQGLLDEIDRLDRQHLTVIGRALNTAIKSARVGLQQRSAAADGRVADSLAQAGRHQDQVIAALEQMLDQLARWDDYRRFHREISQLLRDQQELTARTAEVGRSTLTKDAKDLRPQELADLKILVARQIELARRLDRIQQAMQQTADQLQQSDPLAAQTVADALAEARRLAISGQMLATGGHIDRNQVGQAARAQKQIAEDLQEVLDILANRRQQELVRLVEKLKEAENDLADVEQRQGDLQDEMEAAAGEPDEAQRRKLRELGRRQEQLRKETEQMARRLQRLLADRASRTTAGAAAQMGQAGQCAGGGDCEGASRSAAAAKKDLAQARRELTQRRRQAQAELAGEQLAHLEDDVKRLRVQQQNVVDQTERFEELRRTEGRLTRAQVAGLRDLARRQEFLCTETLQLADQLVGAGAFHLALLVAARDMQQAAELLGRRQTGSIVQQSERHALGRLDMLLEALKPEPPEPGPDNGNAAGGAGGGAKGQGGAPNAARALAELKLLKLLQEEINLRTALLDQAVTAGTLTDQQRRQYVSLSEEQGLLADLVLQLIKPQAQNPEDDPENLPDLREDQDPQRQPRLPLPEEGLP